jgi:NADH pyrophosphatase NudC (nudix superfamily)
VDEKKEYIERGAALLAITGQPSELHYPSWYKGNIMEVPAADVAPVVHGEWCWEGKFKACSKCGSYVEWNETLGVNFWKYCPYCGAKMDGGKTNA